ncbi:MAG: hypothetical protein ACRD3Q_13430 [Terriglobales bacterium]
MVRDSIRSTPFDASNHSSWSLMAEKNGGYTRSDWYGCSVAVIA